MCYRAEAFISRAAASDREQLSMLGWLGEDAPAPIGIIDPPSENEPGVEVRQHPEMLIAQAPELWTLIDEWASGARRKISVRDRTRLSNWHIVALLTMRGAHGRERLRELKRAAKVDA